MFSLSSITIINCHQLPSLTTIAYHMYDGAKILVWIMGESLEQFPVMMELYQESTLNPFLFGLVMDEMTRNI